MPIMTVLVIFVLTTLFALFSTGILSYIALATPLGPWMAPTLVLLASILFQTILKWMPKKNTLIALCAAGGSVGGILATACAFYFPTLYFLNESLFNSWLEQPIYFCMIMTLIALASSLFGFIIANSMEKYCIVEQQMAFPIGQLSYKMIAAQNSMRKAMELIVGFVGTTFFLAAQGVGSIKPIIPSRITLIHGFKKGVLRLPFISIDCTVFPMLWAIGFIAGKMIAIPLAVGALSKILIVNPIHGLFFSSTLSFNFNIAFASGLVASSALLSFVKLPSLIKKGMNNFTMNASEKGSLIQTIRSSNTVFELACAALASIALFVYFKVGFLQSLYLLICTGICTYQVALIAGKIGLAQMGRFATFVMVPAMFLFGINDIHLTLIATFVGVSSGVAADILFGRKLGFMAGIDHKQLKAIQFYGLMVSCFSVGIIFWLLINHFGLGSDQLFAQRAQARALLINIKSFNVYGVIIGALYGFALKRFRLNPMLVLSGLIMPFDYSLGLIAGGLSTLLVKNKDAWEPFCSGMFAGNSVWMLFKTLF